MIPSTFHSPTWKKGVTCAIVVLLSICGLLTNALPCTDLYGTSWNIMECSRTFMTIMGIGSSFLQCCTHSLQQTTMTSNKTKGQGQVDKTGVVTLWSCVVRAMWGRRTHDVSAVQFILESYYGWTLKMPNKYRCRMAKNLYMAFGFQFFGLVSSLFWSFISYGPLALHIVFKSPVLWTGKKPDLDWTGLEKIGPSVAVAPYFFYQPVAVAGIEDLFRTGLDRLRPV